ncbi:MAG: UDP-N-acetylmuramoyl-tripeptide--D-alanyl-D-alanine ligase [Bacteroidota bacterium]|nr:UDP-N-acetylmuramoyl-tripeptide--D-alanyl-D-alanine ligase [Bacteroidota bacterium]
MKTEYLYKILKDNSFNISIDSRKVSGGEVFFALKGENFDGNRFAPEALVKGATVAVIDDPSYERPNTVLVDNVLKELQALALKQRNIFNIPVLAITGSNGKTTTKEILSRVLAQEYKVHYTRDNLNNHIGVPLTLLSCPVDAGFMIVEMGANHIGEIRELCYIARPAYGLITNIGKSHLEGFGSLEAVARAKTELYDYIEAEGGYVFYNENDTFLTNAIRQRQITSVPYLRPGKHKINILEVNQMPHLGMLLEIDGVKYTFHTRLFGLYNLENVLAALSIGLFFNISPGRAQKAIASYMPVNNRSQILKTGKNTLICDSYNANPVSMSRSLESFRKYQGDNKTVILGDMFELGDYETEEHEKLLEELAAMDDLNVILVGKVFNSLARKYNMLSFESREQLIKYLEDKPVRDSLVLIKASRALGLEEIYRLL